MRIFVAGATGVLGRVLIPLLTQRKHAVRALVRSSARATIAGAGIDLVQGDLLAPETPARLPDLLAGCDAVVHAATAIPRNPAVAGAWDTNTLLRTEGTRRLLGAALAAGVGAYVQQSIVMAYPDGGDRWLDERTPIDAAPERAAMCAPVAEMEALVRAIAPARLRWCILRGGLFVGPSTDQDGLIERLRAGRAVTPGDGSAFLSPVHVADMAAAIVLAAEAAPPAATFNVVDEPLRWGSYMDGLARRLGVPPPRRDRSRPAPPSCRCSNAAIRAALGWAPRHSIWPAADAD